MYETKGQIKYPSVNAPKNENLFFFYFSLFTYFYVCRWFWPSKHVTECLLIKYKHQQIFIMISGKATGKNKGNRSKHKSHSRNQTFRYIPIET